MTVPSPLPLRSLESNRFSWVKMENLAVQNLSSHLFWDVDTGKLDPDKQKNLIIQRVLDFGLLSDWREIYLFYGLSTIVDVAKDLRCLDKKSATFLATLCNIPREEFKCFSTTQSKDKLWNF